MRWRVANVNVSQKRFSDFVDNGRLDAEYYQPKYDEIIRTISQYPYGHDKIGNLYILRDKNFLPDNNTRYKYIELSDIGVNGEISGSTYEYGSNLPSRARRVCPYWRYYHFFDRRFFAKLCDYNRRIRWCIMLYRFLCFIPTKYKFRNVIGIV